MKKTVWLLFTALFLLSACKKEDEPKPGAPPVDETTDVFPGIWIANEGNFGQGNASLTVYQEDSNRLSQQVFFEANDAVLGDIAQSMTSFDDHIFIVVNNSGLIHRVSRFDCTFDQTIGGLSSPRDILIVNDQKAYVSDLLTPYLSIINPLDFSTGLTGQVDLGKSAEHMLLIGSEVFVLNWSNFQQTLPNNTIQVINTETDLLVDSIVLAKEPNSLVLDKNGKLWVLCSGGFNDEAEIPALYRVNPVQRSVELKLDFQDVQMSPSSLSINKDGDQLFFINVDLFKMSITSENLPSDSWVEADGRVFYNMEADPVSNLVYATDAGNFQEAGKIYIFDESGAQLRALQAGIIPSDILFNYQ